MKHLLFIVCLSSLLIPVALSQTAPQHVPNPTMYDLLTIEPDYRRLARAFDSAGLSDVIKNVEKHTLLVPADRTLTELESFLGRPELLREILSLHVLVGAYTLDELSKTETVTTISGVVLTVQTQPRLKVGEAAIFGSDVPSSNGNSLFVDRLLLPR